MTRLSRRHFTALGAAGLCLPKVGMAASPREILWEDLIPPGVPYAEIVGEGDMDVENDTWAPIYDENATKLNVYPKSMERKQILELFYFGCHCRCL